MQGNENVMIVYIAYAAVAIVLTAFLARTLFRNGVVFLNDVFEDKPGVADAVNWLLVVGFYMFNLGYAFFVLNASRGLDEFEAMQFFVNRVGALLLVMAVMHFANVFVFWRIRVHKEQRELPPPVAPQVFLPRNLWSLIHMESTRSLTVVYDESCVLCRRCRDWLLTQPCLLPVQLVPAGAPEVRSRYADLGSWLGKELVAIDDRGQAWIGPAAFVTCLWATARYRQVSYSLARPAFVPLAERFFIFVSKRRDRFGTWVDSNDADCSWCDGVTVGRDLS